MSGREPTPLPIPVKEIKEEEVDDFLPEYLFGVQKVEEDPELDRDCKTFNCKEEKSPMMEIKEEESDSREDHQKDSFPTGRL